MKKFLFFSILIPLLSLSQTPSKTFDDVSRTVLNSITDGEWTVEKSLGETKVSLSWLGQLLPEEKNKIIYNGQVGTLIYSTDEKSKMGFYYNYPKMKKNKDFDYIFEPVLYKYSLPSIDNSYHIWHGEMDRFKFLHPEEYRIGNKSYVQLNFALFYEEGGDRYYRNNKTGESRAGSFSSARSKVFKFCNNLDCTIYLEMDNTIDLYDLEKTRSMQFLQTRPILFDLDVYNSKIKNTASNQDIITVVVDDKDDTIKNNALNKGVSAQDLHQEVGTRAYKVSFDKGSSPLAKHYNIDNINFSIDKDFEFSFLTTKTKGLKADHKVLIALGYSGSDLDPNPEVGSRDYQLKFKIEQTSIFNFMYSGMPSRKAGQTFLNVEKYLNGLRIENEKLILKKNYLDDTEGGKDTKVSFKINRIDNNLYLSVEDDVIYVGDVGKFQNNKVIIDHKDLGRQRYFPHGLNTKYNYPEGYEDDGIGVDPDNNNSEISKIVFSNPMDNNEKITNTTPSEWLGNGSGFFISNKGYIATNFHVVEDAKEIEISFNDGVKSSSFSAELAVSDPSNDLAILKINSSDFYLSKNIPYSIKMRSSDIGSEVFALGFPMALSGMGEDIKFTDGKISSKSGFNGDLRLYQTTTPIQPGNSGGPLFDYNGNLIAINSAKISSDRADNVSYSIKSSYLINLMDGLPENINFPNNNVLSGKPLTELIKELSKYVVLIKVK